MTFESESDLPTELKALLGVIQWLSSGEWGERYVDYLETTFGEVLSAYGYRSFTEVSQETGADSVLLQAATIEDFISIPFEDGSNFLQDYVRESPQTVGVEERAYLQAVRDSVVSAYEVLEILGEFVRAKDRLRGEIVRVIPASVEGLEPGDVLVGRAINLQGEHRLSLGTLVYPPETADEAIEIVRSEIADATSRLGVKDAAKRQAVTNKILSESAGLFMSDWLNFLLASLDEMAEDDGPRTVKVELTADINGVRAQLNGNSRLRAEAIPDAWRWLPEFPGEGPIGEAEGPYVRAAIRLNEETGFLQAEVSSVLDAERLVAFLQGVLDRAVGDSSIEIPESDLDAWSDVNPLGELSGLNFDDLEIDELGDGD